MLTPDYSGIYILEELGCTKGQRIYSVVTCLVRTNSLINSHESSISIARLLPTISPKTASNKSHWQTLQKKSTDNSFWQKPTANASDKNTYDQSQRQDHLWPLTAIGAPMTVPSNERNINRSQQQEHQKPLPVTRAPEITPSDKRISNRYQQREHQQPLPETRTTATSPSKESTNDRSQPTKVLIIEAD